MRKFLVLVFLLLSFPSYANSQFEGLWEGFQANDPHISSHLMVINSEGNGYYIIGIGDELAEQSFALVNLKGAEFNNGFIDLPLHKYDTGQASSHLVISKDLLDGNLNCLTIYHDKDGIPIMSFNWSLRKSKTGFAKNNELYKFAQELYYKSLKQD
tara:strand:- start:818 stop:1285 length:468 start_codon:yes stop_codon:yes gene_type:complete